MMERLKKTKVPERKIYDVAESDYTLKYKYGCVVCIAKRLQRAQNTVRRILKGDAEAASRELYVTARLMAIREWEAYPIVVRAVAL